LPSPTWALSQAGTFDDWLAARDRGDADMAMTMMKGMILMIFRRTDLKRTGSFSFRSVPQLLAALLPEIDDRGLAKISNADCGFWQVAPLSAGRKANRKSTRHKSP
jgi:hypothetical protein